MNNNDISAAVEWLFANPDDDGVLDNNQSNPVVNVNQEKSELITKLNASTQSNGKYELQSVICHKGTSPHTGHYVVFIKNLLIMSINGYCLMTKRWSFVMMPIYKISRIMPTCMYLKR